MENKDEINKRTREENLKFGDIFKDPTDSEVMNDSEVIRAGKITREIASLVSSGKISKAKERLESLETAPAQIVFDEYSEGDELDTSTQKSFKIGNGEFDSFSPFESESVCLIAGLTGSGKTTVALNLLKAFSENNDCSILFLESDSETAKDEVKRMAAKIGVKKLTITTFPRYENMKKGFMDILNIYKDAKGKYPDIVFVDTFEKMNASSENYALKENTEALSYLCQQTKCMFVSLSQFSSAQFKATKKAANHFPMSIQQGGMDVINNVNTWISMKRHRIVEDSGAINYNNFYFGKVRNIDASINLFNKVMRVPFCVEDFNLHFKSLELGEAE